MSLLKKTLISLAIVVGGFLLINYNLVLYGISQGMGQLEIVRNARPNEDVLADPDFPDSLKTNLRLVDDIKKYAFDSLGINFSKNYSRVYDQKGKELMFVVSACEPFQLQPKKWKFPLIGSFSYKGFFDEKKAEVLESDLQKQSYDTNIRTAGGWSTLGWFEDPILSNMLDDTEAGFTELLIHELTHGTLFVKDSLRFNENLATFVGIKGTERYLKGKYGIESQELKDYKNQWKDRNMLSEHILKGARYLDNIYRSMNADEAVENKLARKKESIDLIISSIDTLNLNNKQKYIEYFQTLNPNNTFFMSYLRYRGDFTLLENELQTNYQEDIKLMLEDYKNKYPSL